MKIAVLKIIGFTRQTDKRYSQNNSLLYPFDVEINFSFGFWI